MHTGLYTYKATRSASFILYSPPEPRLLPTRASFSREYVLRFRINGLWTTLKSGLWTRLISHINVVGDLRYSLATQFCIQWPRVATMISHTEFKCTWTEIFSAPTDTRMISFVINTEVVFSWKKWSNKKLVLMWRIWSSQTRNIATYLTTWYVIGLILISSPFTFMSVIEISYMYAPYWNTGGFHSRPKEILYAVVPTTFSITGGGSHMSVTVSTSILPGCKAVALSVHCWDFGRLRHQMPVSLRRKWSYKKQKQDDILDHKNSLNSPWNCILIHHLAHNRD